MTEQRSQEWYAKRLGKLTGSRFNELMARTKTGPAASRQNLIIDLAMERFTRVPTASFQSAAMARGIALEPQAREAYENQYLVAVDEIDFIQHPKYDFIGISPDGLVGGDGLLEIKCPSATPKHFMAVMQGRTLPKAIKIKAQPPSDEYKWQLVGQLLCTGRQWVDVASYHPDFGDLSLAVHRVERNDVDCAALLAACQAAEKEIKAAVRALEKAAA